MWKFSTFALVLLAIFAVSAVKFRGYDDLRNHQRHQQVIADQAPVKSGASLKLSKIKPQKVLEKFEDEFVDILVVPTQNGEMSLEFKSHGRVHKLKLRESRQKLEHVTIKLVGSTEQEQKRANQALKNVKLMQDTRFGAVVAVREDADGETESIVKSGVFTLGHHEFHIVPAAGKKARIHKRTMDEVTKQSQGRKVPVELNRFKRSDDVTIERIDGIVELMLITDYCLWEKFSSSNPGDPYFALVLYFAQMVTIVDTHYGNMQNDDLNLGVRFATIMVLTSPLALPELIEDHILRIKGQEYIDGDATLDRLTNWLFNNSDTVPPYDHTMLLSCRDMFNNGDINVKGIAWVESICDEHFSSSFVEVRDTITSNAFVASHELGHGLGSDHDAEDFTSSTFCRDENYIMTPFSGGNTTLNNKFQFSCCSQRSFYATIRNTQCLFQLNSTANYPPSITVNTDNFLPGEVYSADDQCYAVYGTGACTNANLTRNTNMCLALFCIDPFAPSTRCVTEWIGAADGTPCDDGKWCYQGACVDVGSEPTQPDQNCDVRDCYGYELRCRQGTNRFIPTMFLCFPDVWLCDAFFDCTCGSDEENCPVICVEGLVPCPSGESLEPYEDFSPVCIDDFLICNNETNCVDGSDETNCEPGFTTTTPAPPPVVDCGGNFFGLSGTISAPSVGTKYASFANCAWYINVPPGKIVEVTFRRDATIEDDLISCSYDYLQLSHEYDGDIAKLCGLITSGTTYQSPTSSMDIVFLSNGAVTFAKWILDWKAVCPGPDPMYTNYCGQPPKMCSMVTIDDCRGCNQVRETCCSTCDSLLPCEDEAGLRMCRRIRRTCDADRVACEANCVTYSERCCATCCGLFDWACY